MGKKYIPHSDMCGCSRCAAQGDTENPQQVFDIVEDPIFYPVDVINSTVVHAKIMNNRQHNETAPAPPSASKLFL